MKSGNITTQETKIYKIELLSGQVYSFSPTDENDALYKMPIILKAVYEFPGVTTVRLKDISARITTEKSTTQIKNVIEKYFTFEEIDLDKGEQPDWLVRVNTGLIGKLNSLNNI